MISDERVARVLPPGSFIERWTRAKARETDAPLAYHMGVGISMCSTVAPPELQLQLGGMVHAATWIMLVGPAGESRKSTCVFYGLDILSEALPHLVGGKPGSKEAAKEQLLAQPQQLIPYPELGDLFASTTTGYLSGLRDTFTELWDARVVERQLVHRQESRDNPRLCLLGGIAPAFLETATREEDWMNGHMSRWMPLYAVRDPRRKNAIPGTRKPSETAWFVQRLREMHNTPVGVYSGMTPEAAKVYSAWYENNQQRFIDNAPMKWVRGTIERMQTVVLKVAMALSLDIGEAGRGLAFWRLSKADVEFGIAVAEMVLESVIYIVNGLAGSVYGKHRLAVLGAIPFKGKPPRTIGQIYTHCVPKISPRDCDTVLRGLLAEELIEKVTGALLDDRFVQTRTAQDAALAASGMAPAEPAEVTDATLQGFRDLYAGLNTGAGAGASAGARESTSSTAATSTPSWSATTTGEPYSAMAACTTSSVSSDELDDDSDGYDDWDVEGNMDIPDDD